MIVMCISLLSVVCVMAALLAGQAKGPPQEKGTTMSLASDLVPYLSDPTASVILASVAAARWVPAPAEPGWEDGTIELRVVELFCGEGPAVGSTITIAGHRYGDPVKRREMGFDAWNLLPFETGRSFVLALRRSTNTGWIALAGELVAPGDNTLVSGVRRAVEIERLEDQAMRRRMLEEALKSKQDLLFRYALDAISRRARLPRNQAVEMIVQTLTTNALPSNLKFQLVQQATKRPLYDDELGSDPVNRLVIGAVARVLAAETDPQWLVIWAQFLSASLLPAFSPDPAKDQEIRQALIRSVPEPARHQVPGALDKGSQASPQDPRIPKLADIWKAAIR